MVSDRDYKIYESARLAFQKLNPKPNDVIVIKFPDDIHPEQMAAFAEGLQEYVPDDVTVVCSRASVEIEQLSEEQMNSRGWYRCRTKETLQ